MIRVSPDTELQVLVNGRKSHGKLSWYLGMQERWEIQDYYSRERLTFKDPQVVEMIHVRTSYGPVTGRPVSFHIAPERRLRMFHGGCATAGELTQAVQLIGRHGMYVVRAHPKCTALAYWCNVTTLSGIFIDHPATDGLDGETLHALHDGEWGGNFKQVRRARIERDLAEVRRWFPVKHYSDNNGTDE